jgi:histidine triad (HIT) family protein
MSNSRICQIAQGKTNRWMVRQSGSVMAFLPIKMESPGHTIIAPVNHHESLIDAPSSFGAALLDECKALFQLYSRKLSATGFNLLNASGISAQQSVMHLHFHFIPRSHGDGVEAWPTLKSTTVTNDDLLKRLL